MMKNKAWFEKLISKYENPPTEIGAGFEVIMAEEWKDVLAQCPTCSEPLVFNLKKISTNFPFCSLKCKTIDLGEWLIAGEDEEEEEEENV